jgi:CheY-like chemotaxis protein
VTGHRVLVADDERHVANLIRTTLERQGHSVTTVSDGAQAIAELERDPAYTHIVLDLMMPRLNGLEILRWIRTRDETHGAFVVLMSAKADFLSREPFEFQPDLWIEKPVRDCTWF